MRWRGRRQSANIEDRRGMRVPGGRRGGVSCLGILVVLGIAYFTGMDPQALLGVLGTVEQMAPPAQQAPAGPPPQDDPQAQFVGVVLADTEDVWNRIFRGQYREPRLVLFDGLIARYWHKQRSVLGAYLDPAADKLLLTAAFIIIPPVFQTSRSRARNFTRAAADSSRVRSRPG